MKKILSIAAAAVLLISCVKGDIEVDDACTVQSFMTVPAGARVLGSLTIHTTTDFSDAISKMSKFGTVGINLHEMSFTTQENVDLSFIHEVNVGFVKADGSIEPLASDHEVGNVSEITFGIIQQSQELQDAVRNGPFHLVISGQASPPPASFTGQLKVCASLKTEIDKSISDIK